VGDRQGRAVGGGVRGIDDRGTGDRGTRDGFASPGKPAKAKPVTPVPVRASVSDVHLHLYLPIPNGKAAFVDYLDYSWDKTGMSPFSSFGVSLTLFTDEAKGITDLRKSLTSSGTIVVYMGHTSLVATRNKTFVAEGLAPQGAKKPMMKNHELVALLQKAKANIVILAGCATDASVRSKLQNNVIVITTASGSDGVTLSSFWARAITAFLLALVGWDFDGKSVKPQTGGTATVQEAVDAGNKFFPKGDSFVLASGDGNVRQF
jgi:hypothetical protein